MKRKLLPLAVSAVLAGQFTAAHAAEVQVYGQVNLTAQPLDYDYRGSSRKDNGEINSNASRVGVKGDINITEDLKGIYKAEYQFYIDDGVSGNNTGSDEFDARNLYGGLQGTKWGQVIAGRHDTPVKLAQGKIDKFNDLELGDINNYLVGELRMNNIVMYSTPVLSGLTFSLMSIAGEEAGRDTVANDGDNSFSDSLSAAIQYENGGFMASLAADQDVSNTDITRGVVSYKLGSVTLGALYQQAEASQADNNNDGRKDFYGDGIGGVSGALRLAIDATNAAAASNRPYNTAIEEQDGFMMSANWDINETWAVYAQYGQSESTTYDSAAASATFGTLTKATFDTDWAGVGVDYKFNKKVKAFAYSSQQDVDIDNNPNLGDDGDFKTTAVGFEVKF